MAEESTAGLGEAIGLQTNARPYSGGAITKGFQLGMQQELKRAALEANKAAKEDKKRMLAMKAIKRVGAGKFNPILKPIADQIVGEYYSQAPLSNDPLEQQEMGELAKQEIMGLAKVQEQVYDKMINAAQQGYILPSKAIEGLSSYDNNKLAESKASSLLYPFYGVKTENFMGNEVNMPFVSDDIPKVKRDVNTSIRQGLNDAIKKAETRFLQNKGRGKFNVVQELTDEDVDAVARQLASDRDVMYTILSKNEGDALKQMEGKLAKNPLLSADPYLAEEERYNLAVDYLKKEMSNFAKKDFGIMAIPKAKSGGGGYEIAGNVFNPTLSDPSQNVELYMKSGAISPQEADLYERALSDNPAMAEQYLKNLPPLLSISGPNKGAYRLKDENGKEVYLDNTDLIYVPKTQKGGGGKWFLQGISKDILGNDVITNIPVNEQTYGNIISIYPKMKKEDIVIMLNKRMKEGGVKDDKFTLTTTPQRKPVTQKTGGVKRQAAPQAGKKAKPY